MPCPDHVDLVQVVVGVQVQPVPGVVGAVNEGEGHHPLAVGDQLATAVPTDRYPMRVVKVSASGHAIWCLPVRSVDMTTGHLPAGTCNGFPVWDHTYTEAELDLLTDAHPAFAQKATRRQDGSYCLVGSEVQIAVGHARLYRNYAD